MWWDVIALLDVAAGITLWAGDSFLPAFITTLLAGFLIFKGITTLVELHIWIGPINFAAGFVDLVAGITIYFIPFSAMMTRFGAVIGTFLALKGLSTVVMGLAYR